MPQNYQYPDGIPDNGMPGLRRLSIDICVIRIAHLLLAEFLLLRLRTDCD